MKAAVSVGGGITAHVAENRAVQGKRPALTHLRDVDGLRAFAVLAVILFHINERVLPGGFVGVDMFFTVSGFLITRNICAGLDDNRFSLLEFYRRRIKRIAPAMLVAVASTLVVAQLMMLPEDARATAKSAFWSVASAANVYFWRNTDNSYFAVDSRQIPLLHVWSLGVEEQFYLLWPVVLLMAYRTRRSMTIVAVAGAAALVSFALAQAVFPRDANFAYYMLPCRAGELLIGAVFAVLSLRRKHEQFPTRLALPTAILGLLLIVSSVSFLSGTTPFPGWFAVPPTLGTGLLIWAGLVAENPVSKALTKQPLVWIGNVSYSAYLWHWPIIAFYRYGHPDVGFWPSVAMFVATLALAFVTYVLVEQPARRSTAPASRVIALQYFIPAGAVASVALCLIYPARVGLSLTPVAYASQLAGLRAQTTPAFMRKGVCQTQRATMHDLQAMDCLNGDPAANESGVILWGDSNAAQYVGMLEVFAQQAHFQFRNIEIGSCPPIDGDPAPFVEPRRQADCRASLGLVRPIVDRYRTVIMGAAWTEYEQQSPEFMSVVASTVHRLASRGTHVVLLGKIPEVPGYDRKCREKELRYPGLTCPNILVPVSPQVTAMNERLRQLASENASVEYYDPNQYVCPNDVCSAFDRDGSPNYFDPGHLTFDASVRVGTRVVGERGVPLAFGTLTSLGPATNR